MTTRSKAKADEAPVVVEDETPLRVEEVDGEAERRQQRETALHRRRVQYGEFGQWVAGYDLHDDGNALVYAAGHPVPVAAVDEESRAVVLTRHRCHHTPDVRCERFNEPDLWSEAGAVVRPAGWVEDDDQGAAVEPAGEQA